MNILWITNGLFPKPSKVLGLPNPVAGGWLYGLSERLASRKEIRLAIASPYSGNELQVLILNKVVYYLLPVKSIKTYQKKLEPIWLKICREFEPELVHIHGTEYTHGLACMRACVNLNYVISIQGLVSVYARYFYAGLSFSTLLRNITFRDLVKNETAFQVKNDFERRGRMEHEYLLRSYHVIGRTSWDHAHTKTVNPKINYHFCNETLRNEFYISPKWDINKKSNFTIFLSQAFIPLKGLHQVLSAISIIKNDFPLIKIRVAGDSIIESNSFKDRLKLRGYGLFILKLIKKFNLQDHIEFVGKLNADEMIREYLNAHIFVCPSSIENSPNSLGEAQLLGVPTVAAYVGGIPDMLTHGESGLLYRFEEVEMLADNIRILFTDDLLLRSISKEEVNVAEIRHNPDFNLNQLVNIYKKIIEE